MTPAAREVHGLSALEEIRLTSPDAPALFPADLGVTMKPVRYPGPRRPTRAAPGLMSGDARPESSRTSLDPMAVAVVDDNRDFAETLVEILEDHGFRGIAAGTAKEGREKIAAARPGVALVDLNLPDSDGLSLLKDLRRLSPGTLAIVVTGNASLENALEALNEGAYAYLLKEGGAPELLAAVKRAAETARLSLNNEVLTARLVASETKYRDLVENSPDMIHVLDREGRILEVNRTEEQALGLSREELRGRPFVDLVVEELRPNWREHFARVLERGFGRAESGLVGKDGHRIDVEIHATGQLDPVTGQVTHCRGFLRDISGWKRMQRALAEKETLATIGQMAATIAHEVRNPLAGISGAVEVLAADFASDPRKTAVVKEVLARIGRLNAIIGDLLSFSKPLAPSLRPANFRQLLDAARRVLEEDPAVRSIEFEVDDRTDDAVLACDPALMEIALTNLIINAAHAMKGSGRIRIAGGVRPGPSREIAITIDDRGPGVPKEALARVFTPFFTTKVRGTGLGLAITRKIVEAHGGTISIRNRQDGDRIDGATVEILLPAGAEARRIYI